MYPFYFRYYISLLYKQKNINEDEWIEKRMREWYSLMKIRNEKITKDRENHKLELLRIEFSEKNKKFM
jgi:hypothetical protein